ncbi:MAG: metallophosphoesterase family protein [Caldilineaceae bacterium]|nr:metallophosphoesterase family protein [Caldilineaceae bacterium]
MRLAVLADIHGNLPAFQSVLAELERIQPDAVVVNGDLINPVPYNGEVIDYIRNTDWAVVRGNHEFYLLDFGTERAIPGSEDPVRWGSLHWLVRNVSSEQAQYLAALPDERTLYFPATQPIRMAHGVPGRNRVGFYQQQPAEKILLEIRDIPQHTIISAHTHVQVDRQLCLPTARDPLSNPHGEDGHYPPETGPQTGGYWHLLNPGSVGLPLEKDTRAAFAVLESVPESVERGGWRVTHHRVEYDRRPALEAFSTSGLLEAGGPIATIFYWELVTAEPEIVDYYRWCHRNGYDADGDLTGAFAAYVQATGRDAYVRQRDPLHNRALTR